MASPPEEVPPGAGKARRGRQGPLSTTTVNPSQLVHSIASGRIKALEKDKKQLMADSARLQAEIRQLLPENARLEEAMANNSVVTILITIGGSLLSYATFSGNLAQTIANGSAGCLLAGVVAMVANLLRRRSAR